MVAGRVWWEERQWKKKNRCTKSDNLSRTEWHNRGEEATQKFPFPSVFICHNVTHTSPSSPHLSISGYSASGRRGTRLSTALDKGTRGTARSLATCREHAALSNKSPLPLHCSPVSHNIHHIPGHNNTCLLLFTAYMETSSHPDNSPNVGLTIRSPLPRNQFSAFICQPSSRCMVNARQTAALFLHDLS